MVFVTNKGGLSALMEISSWLNSCHFLPFFSKIVLAKQSFMEKLLLVINAYRPDSSLISFGCRMASILQSKLTGLFIENPYFERVSEQGMEDPSSKSIRKNGSHAIATANTEQSIALFKDACQRQQVVGEVYLDKGEPIQEVLYESRFADLLIVDPAMNFYSREEQAPSHFVKEILSRAECPVLLAPAQFEGVEEIVFCYDGSNSSVFAIKLFTYLLPRFSDEKALLLEMTEKKEFNEDIQRIMKWLSCHYASVNYHSMQGGVAEELFSYLFMKRKRMVVMGAYGRSILSYFFKKSRAEALIRVIDLPVFIAHQ